MKTTDLQDLLVVIERLRAETYPELDPAFLQAVVQAEEENPDDDVSALQAIEKALTASLSKKEGA